MPLLVGWAVVGSTQQYLVGGTSLLLAGLQASGSDPTFARELAGLRREAETGPVSDLGRVALLAQELADDLCRGSLRPGDAVAFARQCARGAELREFCLCPQKRPTREALRAVSEGGTLALCADYN
ncbi:hypothetical protein [Streptomyces sp. MBT62]|uniref:hypothetical protein n=1 Tax=Streptomyces sp. MBT62 TaxID=2800410 RepID=UPI00190A4581|nr:hypothetical protein [Streptomyces sp. MBT62]MBK3568151.1 hypothetical protein [Streptomyces sp. MBT62]